MIEFNELCTRLAEGVSEALNERKIDINRGRHEQVLNYGMQVATWSVPILKSHDELRLVVELHLGQRANSAGSVRVQVVLGVAAHLDVGTVPFDQEFEIGDIVHRTVSLIEGM